MSPLAVQPGPDAVVVGSGRLTLDVIVRNDGRSVPPRSQAGGTCGNVLANLAYLGWQAYPLTDLGADDPGRRFTQDLQRWGVHLDLLRSYEGEETPVIIHHIRDTPAGVEHAFSSRCPFCAARLRYYEPIPLTHVEERLCAVPVSRAYFFDRDSPGTLLLARHCKAQGALIVYEPNYAGPECALDEALGLADVFKFSGEKLGSLSQSHALQGPGLVIETLGSAGLRYRDQRTGNATWITLPPFRVAHVRDAGGSGDWCTAGLIDQLARQGNAGFRSATPQQIREALLFGQALGAWNCAFEGARGGVYTVSNERFRTDVERVLAGERFDPAENTPPATQDLAGEFCRHCGGKVAPFIHGRR